MSTGRSGRRWALALVAAAALHLVGAAGALASQLIDRDATDVSLQLNGSGQALVTYRANGALKHVLASGAVNALPPKQGTTQVEFKLDYSGSGTGFGAACGPHDGPPVAFGLITCKAPDGSFWAVQEWQRSLPNYGVSPSPVQAVRELRLSHWTGATAVLTMHTDWSYHRFDHLFGSVAYMGQPVFGFKSTGTGVPLDSFGRNAYIDTEDAPYGPGWRRENSVLTHKGTGVFCYSVNPHGSHPAGKGRHYRVTVVGPGVTPDVSWEGAAPGPYDAAADQAANAEIKALGDFLCRPN